jgi:hypothetical protein
MKTRLITILLIAGLISACGSQATEAPASTLTEEFVPAAEAPTSLPSATAIPTDTAVPTEEPATTSGSEISFANDIIPIIQSRCVTCHGGDRGTEEGLDMTTYINIMAGSDNGPVVLAGDAGGSLLVEMLVQNKMPKRGPKLAPPQVQLIIDWVNQGALNN